MTAVKPSSKSGDSSPFNRTVQHDAKRTAILSQAAKLFNYQGSGAMARASAFFLQHFEDWLAAQEGRAPHIAALLEIAALKGTHRKEIEATASEALDILVHGVSAGDKPQVPIDIGFKNKEYVRGQ